MKRLQAEVLVIGGGATGTGIARDAAMRGFRTVLVEKRDLSNGTTGRYHGLLHSGGRYAVKDPSAARECIEENRVLRRILPHCLEDTGGFFVVTPWDDPAYAPLFLEGCHNAGIPVEEIPISQMLHEEPNLNPDISRCFRVPDAAADSFMVSELNAESARQYGAQVLTYHEVRRIITNQDTTADPPRPLSALDASHRNSTDPGYAHKVIGASCHDLVNDEEVIIYADIVVNATGAWTGKLTNTIGVSVNILPGKGILVALNNRVVNTIINRCKMPSDGDIIVPIHTVAIIGTTDERIADPDNFAIEPWEVKLMLNEGEKLIPGFKNLRFLRAWAGVRPLYQEMDESGSMLSTASRDITRAFTLLDHEKRDRISNLITITGGKWTTYRMMAQATVDLICEKFHVQRACRTHLEELPRFINHHNLTLPGKDSPAAKTNSPLTHRYHTLSTRLALVEKNQAYRDLVCECELATYQDVVLSITVKGAKTLDDIRRDIRLGMGSCQGGFCTYRAAGIMHQLNSVNTRPIDNSGTTPDSQTGVPTNEIQNRLYETNTAILDFLQERWKGLLPILWGQQLRQERLNELIYISILNVDHLPGPQSSRLGSEMYRQPDKDHPSGSEMKQNAWSKVSPPGTPHITQSNSAGNRHYSSKSSPSINVLVIGAGLSGLSAAWRLAKKGTKVRVITKGWGATHWQPGCIDIFGYPMANERGPVASPRAAIAKLIVEKPQHPYALIGLENLTDAIKSFQELCTDSGYPLQGSLERNWLLPTATGAIRPTCLAPETMIAGDLTRVEPILLVGFSQLRDFYPALIADNLSSQGIPSHAVMIDVQSLDRRRIVYPTILAELFEKPEFRQEIVKALKPHLINAGRVGFPAVLGLYHPLKVLHDLEDQLGVPIFEVPTIPPSIPGIRLHNLLVSSIEASGGQVMTGMQVNGALPIDGRIVEVFSEAASRTHRTRASSFILATGGIMGGGIRTDYTGTVREEILTLPVSSPSTREEWFETLFLTRAGHRIYHSGVNVDDTFRPIKPTGEIIYANLYVVGNLLGHADSIRERSFDGVALASGYLVGESQA